MCYSLKNVECIYNRHRPLFQFFFFFFRAENHPSYINTKKKITARTTKYKKSCMKLAWVLDPSITTKISKLSYPLSSPTRSIHLSLILESQIRKTQYELVMSYEIQKMPATKIRTPPSKNSTSLSFNSF